MLIFVSRWMQEEQRPKLCFSLARLGMFMTLITAKNWKNINAVTLQWGTPSPII